MRLETFNHPRRNGYVLIAVLIVIVVLTLAAYRYSDMMFSEFKATDRILKNVEAKALADSGVHYAAAILADPNGLISTLNYNPYNNSNVFQGQQIDLGNGRTGYFSVITPAYNTNTQNSSTGSLPYNFGVMDEASKININSLVALDPSTGGIAYTVLSKLTNMTDEINYNIISWIAPATVQNGGAEDSYYMGLTPPYHCKNGPLDSIEELLLVEGVTPYLLFGDDLNRNGQRDANESASQGEFSYGWAPYLTIYSRESNVSSTGTPRVNVNGQISSTLLSNLQTAVGNDVAAYILAYRIYGPYPATANSKNPAGASGNLDQLVTTAVNGGNVNAKQTISSIWQLVNSQVGVTSTSTSTSTGANGRTTTTMTATTTIYLSPITTGNLSTVLDALTTKSKTTIQGRINVNTASQTVLSTLPGLATSDISAIVANQPDATTADDPEYQTTAWLYTAAQISPTKLMALDSYITARAQVFRIQSVGYFEKNGPMARVEAIVDTNQGYPRIIYYRDLTTDLGRGIDPRTINQ